MNQHFRCHLLKCDVLPIRPYPLRIAVFVMERILFIVLHIVYVVTRQQQGCLISPNLPHNDKESSSITGVA